MAANDSTTRDAFGHWLSGFVDGEGCFLLRLMKGRKHFTGSPRFQIGLRSDDLQILRDIKSFWGIGTITFGHIKSPGIKTNERNACNYRIQSIKDVTKIVIPHFEKYPLRAKKQRDFLIWRQGAELCQRVTTKPTKGCIGHHGPLRSWTDKDLAEFERLRNILRAQRQYNAPPQDIPPLPPGSDEDQPMLF